MRPDSGACPDARAIAERSRSESGDAPGIPKPIENFLELCRARAEQGGMEYGGRSFSRSPADLADEIVEELADIAVWSGILHARVDRMRETFAAADQAFAFVRALRRDLVDGRTSFTAEWIGERLAELQLLNTEVTAP